MKNTIKFLAMLLSLCMVLSLGAVAFASGEPSDEASAEPAGTPARFHTGGFCRYTGMFDVAFLHFIGYTILI